MNDPGGIGVFVQLLACALCHRLGYACRMLRLLHIATLCALVTGCASTIPAHPIPVRQDYVEAGVQPGDTIEVTLKNGEQQSFEVVDVRFNVIEGPDGVVEFADIESIVKRSRELPGHPCGGKEPLGCSIPDVVHILDDKFAAKTGKFHPACVEHDFCYRHGYTTYGETRKSCDEKFRNAMNDACGSFAGLNLFDLENHSHCKLAAEQMYNAVRLKGEPHFRVANSSFCEYDLERDTIR